VLSKALNRWTKPKEQVSSPPVACRGRGQISRSQVLEQSLLPAQKSMRANQDYPKLSTIEPGGFEDARHLVLLLSPPRSIRSLQRLCNPHGSALGRSGEARSSRDDDAYVRSQELPRTLTTPNRCYCLSLRKSTIKTQNPTVTPPPARFRFF
jgi:hypothetical protein